jgi:hypothetical protein
LFRDCYFSDESLEALLPVCGYVRLSNREGQRKPRRKGKCHEAK